MTAVLATVLPLALNSKGLVAFVVQNIVPLILCAIGVAIIAGARKGQMSGVFTTMTIVIIGLVLIAGGGLFYAFANQIANLAFG